MEEVPMLRQIQVCLTALTEERIMPALVPEQAVYMAELPLRLGQTAVEAEEGHIPLTEPQVAMAMNGVRMVQEAAEAEAE
jgi:hypothetical protein